MGDNTDARRQTGRAGREGPGEPVPANVAQIASTMLTRKLRDRLPSRESLGENRYFRRYAPFLMHPNLWHLNRRSVSGGFAVGLFAGLVPGPLQMLTAALLAVPLRVNLPVALVTTLYTNPVTIGDRKSTRLNSSH